MITLTPLSGPYPSPLAYLLTVDSAKILLDCGAFDHSPEFSSSSVPSSSSSSSSSSASVYLKTLEELAPSLSLVVLTHPLLGSLGCLPWLKTKCGLRCPIYATLPTREMGRWAVEEWVEARSREERNSANEVDEGKGKGKGKGKDKMILDDQLKEEERGTMEERVEGEGLDEWSRVWQVSKKEIRDTFLSVNAVRWTQPIHLSGSLKGYTLVAHRSGHTLGGSMYTLRPSLSSSLSPAASASSFLYAPIFNHIKEHHLDGAALLNGAKIDDNMRRMGVVVVGGERSKIINVKRVERDKALLDLITKTLNESNSVMIPTDASARLLELLVLLEMHWTHANLGGKFPLCLVSKTGKEVVAFVRSLTEWMGGQINADERGEKILRFTHLRTFSSLADLELAIHPSSPKLVITVPTTLSHGYSRQLFVHFAQTKGNIVILTSKSEEGSLARWLWSLWNEQQVEGEKWGQGKVGKVTELNQTVDLEMKAKVFLEGAELEAHYQAEREAGELEAKHQALLERSRRLAQADADDDSESDSDDDSIAEEEGTTGIEGGGDEIRQTIRRRVGAFTGGAGAWDEFLDPTKLEGTGGQSFDIYVKGSYSKRVAGETRDGLQRFRMFPVVERKRRVDAYGEAIDVEGWLRRGMDDEDAKDVRSGAGAAVQVIGKRSREEEAEIAEEIAQQAPHKYTIKTVSVALACSIFVVDMEGKNDGRALKTILPQINPRKLIVVNGSDDAIADLTETCRAIKSMTKDLFAPSVGECLTIGEETKSFSVRLGDTIMASLKMSRVEDYDVAYVSGIIHFDPESDLPILERTSLLSRPLIAVAPPQITEITDDVQMTDAAASDKDKTPAGSTVERILPPLTPALFIGDLRLTILKERLLLINVPASFAGEGTLVCGPAPPESFNFISKHSNPIVDLKKGAKAVAEINAVEAGEASGGIVAVKKLGRGRLVIEGTPGETYYVVRRVVYSLHAETG